MTYYLRKDEQAILMNTLADYGYSGDELVMAMYLNYYKCYGTASRALTRLRKEGVVTDTLIRGVLGVCKADKRISFLRMPGPNLLTRRRPYTRKSQRREYHDPLIKAIRGDLAAVEQMAIAANEERRGIIKDRLEQIIDEVL